MTAARPRESASGAPRREAGQRQVSRNYEYRIPGQTPADQKDRIVLQASERRSALSIEIQNATLDNPEFDVQRTAVKSRLEEPSKARWRQRNMFRHLKDANDSIRDTIKLQTGAESPGKLKNVTPDQLTQFGKTFRVQIEQVYRIRGRAGLEEFQTLTDAEIGAMALDYAGTVAREIFCRDQLKYKAEEDAARKSVAEIFSPDITLGNISEKLDRRSIIGKVKAVMYARTRTIRETGRVNGRLKLDSSEKRKMTDARKQRVEISAASSTVPETEAQRVQALKDASYARVLEKAGLEGRDIAELSAKNPSLGKGIETIVSDMESALGQGGISFEKVAAAERTLQTELQKLRTAIEKVDPDGVLSAVLDIQARRVEEVAVLRARDSAEQAQINALNILQLGESGEDRILAAKKLGEEAVAEATRKAGMSITGAGYGDKQEAKRRRKEGFWQNLSSKQGELGDRAATRMGLQMAGVWNAVWWRGAAQIHDAAKSHRTLAEVEMFSGEVKRRFENDPNKGRKLFGFESLTTSALDGELQQRQAEQQAQARSAPEQGATASSASGGQAEGGQGADGANPRPPEGGSGGGNTGTGGDRTESRATTGREGGEKRPKLDVDPQVVKAWDLMMDDQMAAINYQLGRPEVSESDKTLLRFQKRQTEIAQKILRLTSEGASVDDFPTIGIGVYVRGNELRLPIFSGLGAQGIQPQRYESTPEMQQAMRETVIADFRSTFGRDPSPDEERVFLDVMIQAGTYTENQVQQEAQRRGRRSAGGAGDEVRSEAPVGNTGERERAPEQQADQAFEYIVNRYDFIVKVLDNHLKRNPGDAELQYILDEARNAWGSIQNNQPSRTGLSVQDALMYDTGLNDTSGRSIRSGLPVYARMQQVIEGELSTRLGHDWQRKIREHDIGLTGQYSRQEIDELAKTWDVLNSSMELSDTKPFADFERKRIEAEVGFSEKMPKGREKDQKREQVNRLLRERVYNRRQLNPQQLAGHAMNIVSGRVEAPGLPGRVRGEIRRARAGGEQNDTAKAEQDAQFAEFKPEIDDFFDRYAEFIDIAREIRSDEDTDPQRQASLDSAIQVVNEQWRQVEATRRAYPEAAIPVELMYATATGYTPKGEYEQVRIGLALHPEIKQAVNEWVHKQTRNTPLTEMPIEKRRRIERIREGLEVFDAAQADLTPEQRDAWALGQVERAVQAEKSQVGVEEYERVFGETYARLHSNAEASGSVSPELRAILQQQARAEANIAAREVMDNVPEKTQEERDAMLRIALEAAHNYRFFIDPRKVALEVVARKGEDRRLREYNRQKEFETRFESDSRADQRAARVTYDKMKKYTDYLRAAAQSSPDDAELQWQYKTVADAVKGIESQLQDHEATSMEQLTRPIVGFRTEQGTQGTLGVGLPIFADHFTDLDAHMLPGTGEISNPLIRSVEVQLQHMKFKRPDGTVVNPTDADYTTFVSEKRTEMLREVREIGEWLMGVSEDLGKKPFAPDIAMVLREHYVPQTHAELVQEERTQPRDDVLEDEARRLTTQRMEDVRLLVPYSARLWAKEHSDIDVVREPEKVAKAEREAIKKAVKEVDVKGLSTKDATVKVLEKAGVRLASGEQQIVESIVDMEKDAVKLVESSMEVEQAVLKYLISGEADELRKAELSWKLKEVEAVQKEFKKRKEKGEEATFVEQLLHGTGFYGVDGQEVSMGLPVFQEVIDELRRGRDGALSPKQQAFRDSDPRLKNLDQTLAFFEAVTKPVGMSKKGLVIQEELQKAASIEIYDREVRRIEGMTADELQLISLRSAKEFMDNRLIQAQQNRVRDTGRLGAAEVNSRIEALRDASETALRLLDDALERRGRGESVVDAFPDERGKLDRFLDRSFAFAGYIVEPKTALDHWREQEYRKLTDAAIIPEARQLARARMESIRTMDSKDVLAHVVRQGTGTYFDAAGRQSLLESAVDAAIEVDRVKLTPKTTRGPRDTRRLFRLPVDRVHEGTEGYEFPYDRWGLPPKNPNLVKSAYRGTRSGIGKAWDRFANYEGVGDTNLADIWEKQEPSPELADTLMWKATTATGRAAARGGNATLNAMNAGAGKADEAVQAGMRRADRAASNVGEKIGDASEAFSDVSESVVDVGAARASKVAEAAGAARMGVRERVDDFSARIKDRLGPRIVIESIRPEVLEDIIEHGTEYDWRSPVETQQEMSERQIRKLVLNAYQEGLRSWGEGLPPLTTPALSPEMRHARQRLLVAQVAFQNTRDENMRPGPSFSERMTYGTGRFDDSGNEIRMPLPYLNEMIGAMQREYRSALQSGDTAKKDQLGLYLKFMYSTTTRLSDVMPPEQRSKVAGDLGLTEQEMNEMLVISTDFAALEPVFSEMRSRPTRHVDKNINFDWNEIP